MGNSICAECICGQ